MEVKETYRLRKNKSCEILNIINFYMIILVDTEIINIIILYRYIIIL